MDQREIDALMATADANPADAEAQVAAAWANDSHGSEFDAMRYYDAAWAAGVSSEIRCRFMVGYGSTLRNNDRLDESIALHRQAILDYPAFASHQPFLALALNRAGRYDEALAEALTALVDAGAANLDGYERSLVCYRDFLLGSE
ncbi:MAG: tetratricopeptide repeat protein [Actinomycetota bacterium]